MNTRFYLALAALAAALLLLPGCATVVATAVDGTVEVVRDSENGRLAAAGNIEKMAKAVAEIIARYGVREVVHFAGSALIQESMDRPLDYYANNTAATTPARCPYSSRTNR
mgnify:CR=1 FL=1